jgi:hypothetical protein
MGVYPVLLLYDELIISGERERERERENVKHANRKDPSSNNFCWVNRSGIRRL